MAAASVLSGVTLLLHRKVMSSKRAAPLAERFVAAGAKVFLNASTPAQVALVEDDTSKLAVTTLLAAPDMQAFNGTVVRVSWALDSLDAGAQVDLAPYRVAGAEAPSAPAGPAGKRQAREVTGSTSVSLPPSPIDRVQALLACAGVSEFHLPEQLLPSFRQPEAAKVSSLPRGEWMSVGADGRWLPGFTNAAGPAKPAASAVSKSKSGGIAALFGKSTPAAAPKPAITAHTEDLPVHHGYTGWGCASVLAMPGWGAAAGGPTPAGYHTPMLALDVDDTVVRVVKTGRAFPSSSDDWGWWHPGVVKVLQEVHGAGVPVVLLTNQSGASGPKAATRAPLLRDRLGGIAAALAQAGVPTLTIAATASGDFLRKPRPGMWMLAQELLASTAPHAVGAAPSPPVCAYVGDAGGRSAEDKTNHAAYLPPKRAGKSSGAPVHKKDHSTSDLQLALNMRVPFLTPDALFAARTAGTCGSAVMNPSLATGPLSWVPWRDWGEEQPPALDVCSNKEKAVVVCIGPPGAGKSTWCKQVVGTWAAVVNQDTLGSKGKCLAAGQAALEDGLAVFVDATNRDPATRNDWVKLAGEAGVPAVAVVFPGDVRRATHQNILRGTCPFPAEGLLNPDDRRLVNPAIIAKQFGPTAFVPPTAAEGFAQVHSIVPGNRFPSHPNKLASAVAAMFMGKA